MRLCLEPVKVATPRGGRRAGFFDDAQRFLDVLTRRISAVTSMQTGSCMLALTALMDPDHLTFSDIEAPQA